MTDYTTLGSVETMTFETSTGGSADLELTKQRRISRQVGTFDVEFAVRNFDSDSAPDGGRARSTTPASRSNRRVD